MLGQEFGMLALRRVSMFDILKLLRTKEADIGIWLVFDVQSDTAMNGLKDFVGIENCLSGRPVIRNMIGRLCLWKEREMTLRTC